MENNFYFVYPMIETMIPVSGTLSFCSKPSFRHEKAKWIFIAFTIQLLMSFNNYPTFDDLLHYTLDLACIGNGNYETMIHYDLN